MAKRWWSVIVSEIGANDSVDVLDGEFGCDKLGIGTLKFRFIFSFFASRL